MKLFGILIASVVLCAGCGPSQGNAPVSAASSKSPGTNSASSGQRMFQVKGVIIAVKPREKTLEIKHEEIPDYMPAMTMPFDVKDTNVLAGLEPGEPVEFRLVTTDTDAWIDQIRKTGPNLTLAGPPTTGPFRVARDVEPLEIGDTFPEYHLTNQLGQAFSTRQYVGQALAITFLFTRCPYPTFCPRMANNFEEVQQKLLSMTGAPTNWHLLTVSFDPEFDQPAVLKAYAQSHQYQPDHWTFATGSLVDITALGEQAGLAFWHDETGSISHNLRTVVVNSAGRVQASFQGNQWTSGELVAEMLKAARTN